MKWKFLVTDKFYPPVILPNCYYINRFGKIIDDKNKLVNDISCIDFSKIECIFIFVNSTLDDNVSDIMTYQSFYTLNQISVLNYITQKI